MNDTDRDFFLDYAWRFVKTPYAWGGDDPMAGFDCSGFAIECLKAIGQLPYGGDWTAQMLWERFKHQATPKPQPGCLAFWKSNSSGAMTHIEIVVHQGISLGASGGGSRTKTLADAIEQNAYIRARPYANRDDRGLFFADPFEED